MNKSLTKDDFLPGSSKIRLRCAFINVPKKYLHYRKKGKFNFKTNTDSNGMHTFI